MITRQRQKSRNVKQRRPSCSLPALQCRYKQARNVASLSTILVATTQSCSQVLLGTLMHAVVWYSGEYELYEFIGESKAQSLDVGISQLQLACFQRSQEWSIVRASN